MKNKYVHKYSDFLVEQDMTAMGMPVSVTPAPKKIEYHFLFMTGADDNGNKRRKYPDGSTIIEYPCYSIEANELSDWTKKNIVEPTAKGLNKSEIDIRIKSLEEIVKGDRTNISNDDLPFIEKLKNAVSANIIGKVEPEVTVVFSDGVPTTNDVNVTFIKHKK
jgi:hypothetical protein